MSGDMTRPQWIIDCPGNMSPACRGRGPHSHYTSIDPEAPKPEWFTVSTPTEGEQ